MPNNISYYLDGTKKTATALKLVLNINNQASSLNAIEVFLTNVNSLYKKALDASFPDYYEKLIRTGTNFEEIVGDKKTSFIKNEWENATRVYSYEFKIESYKA